MRSSDRAKGSASAPIERITPRAFRIPTDAPEADGTLSWDATGLVLVEVEAAGEIGLGYTYAAPACAAIIADPLSEILRGRDAFDIPRLWTAMVGGGA